eukprot:gb/GECG01010589.1/.p1 GENE.gb/GECG01010589.1/~~gb/GECG01010589.1/.p1  ORF type:complete len:103 (+),score=9.41 gb/GECG01010589.1/:1-309(+)
MTQTRMAPQNTETENDRLVLMRKMRASTVQVALMGMSFTRETMQEKEIYDLSVPFGSPFLEEELHHTSQFPIDTCEVEFHRSGTILIVQLYNADPCFVDRES